VSLRKFSIPFPHHFLLVFIKRRRLFLKHLKVMIAGFKESFATANLKKPALFLYV
jgi:hypothetical protein